MRLLSAAPVIVAMACPVSAAAETIRLPAVQIVLIDDVHVPARAAGTIRTINSAEGARVPQGGLIAQIDDRRARLTVEQARGELEIEEAKANNDINVRFAQKSREVARAELRRAENAVKRFAKAVSDSEMDALRLAAERAALQIEQAQRDLAIAAMNVKLRKNELEAAEAELERHRIVAPFAGMVVELKRRRGEWVQPGETVARLVRIDRLRAKGFLKADSIRGELLGRPVTVTVDLPGEPAAEFSGVVSFVSPEVDPNDGVLAVWADIRNPDLRLKPGLHGEMSIEPAGP